LSHTEVQSPHADFDGLPGTRERDGLHLPPKGHCGATELARFALDLSGNAATRGWSGIRLAEVLSAVFSAALSFTAATGRPG
jgi:hypothetical protein